MIATCPSCSARYKIDDSKIKGRGAKINCPRCSHRFVVYKGDDDGSATPERRVPDDVARLDFSTLGITWRVRKGDDVGYEFFDLATLQDFLRTGQIDRWDAISFDNREWTPIEAIDDLEAFFYDVWQRAVRGEIVIAPPADAFEDDEDEADAPTTIVGRGSSLATEIRHAVTQAATPRPVVRAATPRAGDRGSSRRYDASELAAEPHTAEVPRESTPVPAAPVPVPRPAAPVPENEPAPAPIGPAPSLADRSPGPRRGAAAGGRHELDGGPPPGGNRGALVALVAAAFLVFASVVVGGVYVLGQLGAPDAPSHGTPERASALASANEEGTPTEEADPEAETPEPAADGG